jgi:sialidase-1
VWARIEGARNDGAWHRVVLRRGGGRLSLFVDGERADTADLPGSVSRDSPFEVRVGARTDDRAHFAGAIDDVRVWERALTDEEVTGGRAAGDGTVLWLPMDRVDAGG